MMFFSSHWIPKSLFTAALLVITWLSLRPKTFVEEALSGEPSNTPHFVMEIIAHGPHFAAYAALVIIGALTIRRRQNLLILGAALLSLSLVFEGLQTWVPNRTPNVDDMIANALGVMFGVGLSFFLLPKLAKWLGNQPK